MEEEKKKVLTINQHETQQEIALLKASLKEVQNYALQQISKHKTAVPVQLVDQVATAILELVHYNQQLEANSGNPELTAELYLKISTSFSNSPDLRLTWLENLSHHYSQNKNWEEASLCRIMVASLIAQCLEKHGMCPIDYRNFTKILPNSFSELPLPDGAVVPDGARWSVNGLIKNLHEGVLLMKQVRSFSLSLFCAFHCSHFSIGKKKKRPSNMSCALRSTVFCPSSTRTLSRTTSSWTV